MTHFCVSFSKNPDLSGRVCGPHRGKRRKMDFIFHLSFYVIRDKHNIYCVYLSNNIKRKCGIRISTINLRSDHSKEKMQYFDLNHQFKNLSFFSLNHKQWRTSGGDKTYQLGWQPKITSIICHQAPNIY